MQIKKQRGLSGLSGFQVAVRSEAVYTQANWVPPFALMCEGAELPPGGHWPYAPTDRGRLLNLYPPQLRLTLTKRHKT